MAESAAPSPGRIFISYRREETAYPAGWLFDRLADHFGGEQVFKDVDSIELGDDFVEVITAAVGSCDVLLALIGDRWLTVTDGDGRRRIDNPGDFVRVEIEAALTRNVRVIPILVDGAPLPRAAELPASLAKLVRRQALELSPARFDFDTGRLLKVLDKTLADARTVQKAAPSTTTPDPHTTALPRSPEQREPVASFTPSRLPPTAPATPAGPSPLDSSTPVKQRWRLSTRARVLAGAGISVALILLIVAIVVNSNTTSPPSGATPSSSTKAVIFTDHFSGQLAGWNESGDNPAAGYYMNGAYRIKAVPDETTGEARSPINASKVYPFAPPNIRIEVDGRILTGNESDTYGVLCREDESRGYSFAIGSDQVSIIKYTDSSAPAILANTDTSAIKANGINRIQVECTSDGQRAVHLAFALNGQVLAEATDKTDPFETGTVGLFAAPGPGSKKAIEAEFDNFVVTQL